MLSLRTPEFLSHCDGPTSTPTRSFPRATSSGSPEPVSRTVCSPPGAPSWTSCSTRSRGAPARSSSWGPVWALQNYGFKVVIGSRFADIFRNNSGNNGLLLAQVDPAVVEKLWDFAEHNPGEKLTVSLEDKTISLPDGTSHPFVIDDATRQRLLAGLDAIGETLEYADDIAAYEARRPSFLPTTA